MKQEFERRGVSASYTLDRVGFRTQKVRNLVIGDPKRPDLTARTATIQTRLKLDGSVEVYRIVARGVRLRGRMVGGKVRWGELDKLLPPPSDKPFKLPSSRSTSPTARLRLPRRSGRSVSRCMATAICAAASRAGSRSAAHA